MGKKKVTRKRKKQSSTAISQRKEFTVRSKSYLKSWLIGVLVILGILAGFVYQIRVANPTKKALTRKEIIVSTDKTYEYTKSLVRNCMKALPNKTQLSPQYGPRPQIKQRLQELLDGGLEDQLVFIQEGERLLADGPPLKIDLIGDLHPSIGAMPEHCKKRQLEIREKIRDINPPIAFIENELFARFDIKQSKLQIHKAAAMFGRHLSEKEIDEGFDAVTSDLWWRPFLDTNQPILYGIDNKDINNLVLDLMDYKQMSDSGPAYTILDCLNFLWREQLFISAMIKAMRTEQVETGVIVVGEIHEQTLPMLLRQWGIDCNVL